MKKILTGVLALGLAPNLVGTLAACTPASTNKSFKTNLKNDCNEGEYLQLVVKQGEVECEIVGPGHIETPEQYFGGYTFSLKSKDKNHIVTKINLYPWFDISVCELQPTDVTTDADGYYVSTFSISKTVIEDLWSYCPAYSEIVILPEFVAKKIGLISLNPFVTPKSEVIPPVYGQKYTLEIKAPNYCAIDINNIFVWSGDRQLKANDGFSSDYDYTFTVDSDNHNIGTFVFEASNPGTSTPVITDDIKYYVGTQPIANEHEIKLSILGPKYSGAKVVSSFKGSILLDTDHEDFEMDIPSFISEHSRQAVSATWSMEGATTSPQPLGIFGDKITGTIENCKEVSKDTPLEITIKLGEPTEANDFEHDSWSNFAYWLDFAEHDLAWFAGFYNLDNINDLIGQKRHVMWDGMDHVVKIVGKQEYAIATPQEDQWADPIIDPDSKPADFTFMFDNLLTKSNGDIVKIKFKGGSFVDTELNVWIQQHGSRRQGDTFETSYARDFVNSKKDFLDKFSDFGFLDAVKGISHYRLSISNCEREKTYKYTYQFWDKFFVPTACELGGTFNFYPEDMKTPTEKAYYTYLEQAEDYSSTPIRQFRGVNHQDCDDFWTASPSYEGGGPFATEDMAYVMANGQIANCDMDNRLGLLLMFCI